MYDCSHVWYLYVQFEVVHYSCTLLITTQFCSFFFSVLYGTWLHKAQQYVEKFKNLHIYPLHPKAQHWDNQGNSQNMTSWPESVELTCNVMLICCATEGWMSDYSGHGEQLSEKVKKWIFLSSYIMGQSWDNAKLIFSRSYAKKVSCPCRHI